MLVRHGVRHGYAIASWFQPDGVLGEVHTVSRPAIYRDLHLLEARGLVVGTEDRGGRQQVKRTLRLTSAGERAAKSWLDSPVEHLRDVRNELLAKLLLREHFGLPVTAFIKRQRSRFAEVVGALLRDGDASVVAAWRREHARAVARFLDEYEGATESSPATHDDLDVHSLSARNQLRGRVATVKHGGILSSVKITIEPGQTMTSTITREATDQLRLSPGSEVVAVCKATDVMVAAQPPR